MKKLVFTIILLATCFANELDKGFNIYQFFKFNFFIAEKEL